MAEIKYYHIQRFNGENYQNWKRQMEIFMRENKLAKYILGEERRPAAAGAAQTTWDEKDIEAQAFLMRGLELSQLQYLSDCDTAAKMWARLKSIHAERSDQSVQVLLEQFITCKMKEDEKVADLIARIVSLSQRLKDMDMEQSQPVIIAKILSSLPEKFDNVRTAWYAVAKADQTVEKLTDHLVNEEALLKMRQISTESAGEALFARGRGRGSSGSRGTFRRSGTCNYCHQPGHWARECPGLLRKEQRKQNQSHNSLNKNAQSHGCVADDSKQNRASADTRGGSSESHNFAAMFIAEEVNVAIQEDNWWFADSGATEHMTFRRDWFHRYVDLPDKKYGVRMGGKEILFARGKGEIHVKVTGNDIVHTITNVLYVPGMHKNLLSVNKTAVKGFDILFKKGGEYVHLLRDDEIIAAGKSYKNGLYLLNLQTVEYNEANVSQGGSLMIWHERLGHPNFKTLKEMITRSTVDDLVVQGSMDQELFCEGCVLAKQHRQAFPKEGVRRSKVPGELFHMDLSGKASSPSLGGSNYFLLLKDDCTRYCFIYFLKEKSDVLKYLQQFYADVKADGHTVHRIRSDCGLEFCNTKVDDFLRQNLIKHETSTPRAPEQNGFIERQNRTVVESAKAMLHSRKLPLNLWAAASHTAVFLKNRTASVTLNGSTPYEKWHGEKPSVENLRAFGSVAWAHISKQLRTKYEENSEKYLMVGYHEGGKAYRLYNPVTRNCVIRRDVIFDESIPDQISTIVTQSVPVPPNDNLDDDDDVFSGRENVPGEDRHHTEERNQQRENETTREVRRANPRMPIPRDPYHLRKRSSRVDSVRDEENNFVFAETLYSELESLTLEDVLNDPDSEHWLSAIDDELKSLEENQTWILVPRPESANVIGNRWVFRRKFKADGSIDKFKARLVAKGYAQQYGIDYTETYAPVVKSDSIRMFFAIAAALSMTIIQFDIKTAFLYGDLNEKIFMEPPEGFEIDDRVCLLTKSLYGLKQAPKQWNYRFDKFLRKFGFIKSSEDECVYIYNKGASVIHLILHVDDGNAASNDQNLLNMLLEELKKEFKITSGTAEYFVGIQIEKNERDGVLKLHQSAYTRKILEKFNHLDCAPHSVPADPGMKFVKETTADGDDNFPYKQAIGSLMYLMVTTRPDIAFIISVLSQFSAQPSRTHWNGVKLVFRYLKGTLDYGITYGIGTGDLDVTGYCDSDWAGDVETRRSTTGWIYTMNNGPIAWSSRKQTSVATSATEAEFMALCAATKEAVWLQRLHREMQLDVNKPICIYCDNQAAILLVKHPEAAKRSKHVDTQYRYTCEQYQNQLINVEYIPTNLQLADPLTKALPKWKFQRLRTDLGIVKCGAV